MRIIVSDSSCLIDLRKASLLEGFLKLPYEIVIPNTLFEEELLKFSETEKRMLLDGGMKVIDLPGKGVLRAQAMASGFPSLSLHDCFAFALAESNPDCILLTADGSLRSTAKDHGIEVHGVLWAIDEMGKTATVTTDEIIHALELFASDPSVYRLPIRDLRAFIKRYGADS
jgi:hypothetical protein